MIRNAPKREQLKSVSAEDIRNLPRVTAQSRDALVRLSQQIAELPEVERKKMEYVLAANLLAMTNELNVLCSFNRYVPAIDAALRNDDMDAFIATLDAVLAHSSPCHRSFTRPS